MNIFTSVVSKDLCISCRACAQICPQNIITFEFKQGSFRPLISKDKCTECGLCTKVCPSYQNDLSEYNKETVFSGSYLNSYVAHSNNNTLRENSSSGGVVTNMILGLLTEGHYKKAAVVLYDKFEGQADYTITSDHNIILAAAKSKYIPVSTQKILEDLKDATYEPIIIVATPCQIYAIRSYCKLKRIDITNILFLGLFCEHTLNYNIYNYYSQIYGDYDKMYFRSKFQKGWPGHTEIVKGENQILIDRGVRMLLKPIFKNNRCRFCFDKLNAQADISFGDHYVKGEGSLEGKSSVIIRTEKGENAFKSIASQFTFQDSPFSEIANSQGTVKLEVDYARAQQLNKDMYKNMPFVSNIITDAKNEKREYSKLRIGAMTITHKDFLRISKSIKKKNIFVRIAKKIYKKLKNI